MGGKQNHLGKAMKNLKQKERRTHMTHVQQTMENARVAAEEERARQTTRDPSKKKLKSIWETSNLEEFLMVADDRENGYHAERNVRVVVKGNPHVLAKNNKIVPQSDMSRNWYELNKILPIPHRPPWTYDMHPQELEEREKQSFLNWRRKLSETEEKEGVVMTPYERNLEVWRQLWRVVERSDVVLLIVDARNPLVYRSHDFEQYVKKHTNKQGVHKRVVLLLNKADLLLPQHRLQWAEYWKQLGVEFIFFSANPGERGEVHQEREAEEKQSSSDDSDEESEEIDLLGNDTEEEDEAEEVHQDPVETRSARRTQNNKLKGGPIKLRNPYEVLQQRNLRKQQQSAEQPKKSAPPRTKEEVERDERLTQHTALADLESHDIVTPLQLLDRLAELRGPMKTPDDTTLVVGMVGFPNVGKSSTINALIGCKKVVVSQTPGKTKHFQTLPIPNERRVMLCDCPGLNFPSFFSNREAMVCDGILPVDNVKDYTTPIGLICRRVARCILERVYGVSLNKRNDLDDSETSAELLLNAYARRRGYWTDHGRPNRSKAAKDILKDYVAGGIVYVQPPPGLSVPDVISQAVREHYAPRARGAPKDDEASSKRAEDEEWEDVSEAADARGLSDDEMSESSEEEAKGDHPALFYDRQEPTKRSLTQVSPEEYFNAFFLTEQDVNPVKKERRRKKKVNHQAEGVDDFTTHINKKGERELILDSDDDICELGEGYAKPQKDKKLTKRALRKQARQAGTAALLNPTKKVVAIDGGL